MIRTPHLKLIGGHSVRHGIRGGAGLVALLCTLLLGLILANIVISPLELVDKGVGQMHRDDGDSEAEVAVAKAGVNGEVMKLGRKAIDWAVSPTPAQLDYMTNDKPVIVSAILVLLFLVTPLLTCLGGFNQTSGDIGSKGLRFLLIRTERPNIYLGRFIGTFLFSAVIYAVLFAILALYMAGKVHVHPAGAMVGWLGQGYFRLLLFSLPYMAMCAWISSSIDSPFGSLVVALLVAYVIPMIVGMAGNINEAARYGQYITPWGYKWLLLEPLGLPLLGGIAVMLGFTGLFLFIGLTNFNKRDL